MEGLSVSSRSLYSGLKGYWKRRRGYQRLNGSGMRRKNRVVEYKSRRWFWKINIKRKLKLKLKLKLRRFSLKKLLMNMRDAYMNMMMKVANTGSMSSGIGGFNNGFGMRPLKEYDERVFVEIYKSMLIAQGQLVPRNGAGVDGAKVCSQIMCQR